MGHRETMKIRPMTLADCNLLGKEIRGGAEITAAIRKLDPVCLDSGTWRLYSDQYPQGGISQWNMTARWRAEWGIAAAGFQSIGEDLFGNQIIVRNDSKLLHLWNHENGEQHDLLLEPVDLFETVLESNLDWIDFYADGSLSVARKRVEEVSLDQHLHWTVPLILGGSVIANNTSLVERLSHLVGHAKLWRQISDLPPGSSVMLT